MLDQIYIIITGVLTGDQYVYRSPTSSAVNDEKLHKLLAESNSRGPSQVIVMGDFKAFSRYCLFVRKII